MSSQGKILHKQQYQNAQQVIEVTVKAKPRVKFGLKTKQKHSPKPFVRDCFLRKELEKYVKETEAKRLKIKADKMNPIRPMPNLKINQPNTVIDIYDKSRKERNADNKLPPEITWKELLKDINSESTNSHSNVNPIKNVDDNGKSEDKQLKFGANEINQEKPMTKSKLDQFNTVTETHKKKKDKKGHDMLPSDVTWGQYLKDFSLSNSDTSQIVNVRSGENIAEKSSPIKKYRIEYQIPEKDRAIPRKHKSAKFKGKQNKSEFKGQEIINKLNAENINKHLNRQEMPIILPTASCKPLLINRSMQTSLISRSETASPDQLDYQKSLPKSTKTQSEQTHTPLGESALKLLRQLRDRLNSIGDNEGSEIVNLLEEAYFGSAEGKPNKGELDIGDSASPFFLSTFKPSESQIPTSDIEKQKLKRIIEEQDRKLQEQERAIQELKSLSQKLLAYHEQLKEQAKQLANDNAHNNSVNSCSNKSASKGADSGIDSSVSEDALKRLAIERDSVVQDNRNLRQIILNLEIKLNKYESENEIQIEKRQFGSQESCQKQHVSSLVKNAEEPRDKGIIVPPTNSDADSAYEDKSYKSSRSTSKASSNINRVSALNQEKNISALKDGSLSDASVRVQDDLSFRHVLSDVGQYYNNISNCIYYERQCPQMDVTRSFPTELNSNRTAMYSDLSSELHTESAHQEASFIKRFVKDKGKLFSETPIDSATDNYFESTHVNDKKSNSLNLKTAGSKAKFAPPLSYINSVLSDDGSTTFEPVEMNHSNSL